MSKTIKDYGGSAKYVLKLFIKNAGIILEMTICLSATVAISAIIVAFNHKATGSNGH